MTIKHEKDNQPIPREMNEAAIIRNLSLVSLIGNTILSGFKMLAGIAGNSGAMISDAIHSFSDVLTTLIAWIGVKISKKEGMSSFLCKFLKKYFGEGYLPSLESVRFYQLLC